MGKMVMCINVSGRRHAMYSYIEIGNAYAECVGTLVDGYMETR